jgi:hypothetical protein
MTLQIRKATRTQARLRLGLIGPAGSGKTYTALKVAMLLAQGKPVLVLDTEHGSAEKYADYNDAEVGKLSFDTITPDAFSPDVYIEAIRLAEQNGYAVLVLDSLSHAWMGKGGALELVDKAQARQKTQNSFTAWRDVTPLHNAMINAIVGARVHIIATLRSKMEYVQEKDANGKTIVRKVGLQPVQRDGLEYEFDVVGDLDQDNNLVIGKTRCPALTGGVFAKPGRAVAETLITWLSAGVQAPIPSVQSATQPESPLITPSRTAELRKLVDVTAKKYADKARDANENQRKMAFLLVREVCGNDDAKRHTLQTKLTGFDHWDKIPGVYILALIEWLKPYKNGDNKYHPDKGAFQDVESIVKEALVEAGQQTMALAETNNEEPIPF